MRQAFHAQTAPWVQFEASARQLIHDMPSPPDRTAQDSMLALETSLRELYIQYFPKHHPRRLTPSLLQSISSRMWHARREALRVRGRSLRSMFLCWRHATNYLGCQKQIRTFSRANKRLKLETILAEGADLVLHRQTFEWYRKIRQFCPKQKFRRTQMFDQHGMPLSPTQEIQLIEQYYTALYSDDQLPQFGTDPLTSAPFDRQALTDALRALPGTKALAPDGIPALVWKHFAEDLAHFC